MIKGLLKQNRRPIGIDFGTQNIRLVQLAAGPQGRAVAVAAACRSLPADLPEHGQQRSELLIERLHDMLASSGAKGRAAVCCLPAMSLDYRQLRLQHFEPRRVRQEVMASAAPALPLQAYTQVLRACGLRVHCIEAVPSALARTCCGQPGAAFDAVPQVVLDVGYSSSKVLIVQRRRVAFFHLIDIGGAVFDQCVAQQLCLPLSEVSALRRQRSAAPGGFGFQADARLFDHVGPENVRRAVRAALRQPIGALACQLRLCLRDYSVNLRGRGRGWRPQAVQLAGGEAQNLELKSMLGREIDVSFTPMRIDEQVDFSSISEPGLATGPCSQWAVAAGLALWQHDAGSARRAA